MPKTSLRDDLVSAGLRVMFQRGYHGAAVRDVAAEAKAGLGSFTNHFRSKEAFGREVLDRYFAYVQRLVGEALDDESLSPRDRLRRYLDIITGKLERDDWSRGCLIGDFSLEVPGHSEELRQRLREIFVEWRAPFAACITAAQAQGEIATAFTPDDLADFLLASWEGAILRMKVDRNPAALERFKAIAFATVFAKP